MNQILSTNMPNNNGKKSGQNGPKNIKSIVIFFVAVLIIFAVVLIGMGAYTLLKRRNNYKNCRKTSNYVGK